MQESIHKKHSIFRAKKAGELKNAGEKVAFTLWSIAALLFSSAVITVLSLLLAIGMFDIEIFYDYFRHPAIFLVNYVPVLLMNLVLYCITGRQWSAYLITAGFILLASAGNFYKQKFRYEPFTASDLGMVKAGLGMAGNYDLTPNARILLCIAALICGTILLALLVRARPGGKLRIAGILLSICLSAGLWKNVYSSNEVYYSQALSTENIIYSWVQQEFACKGFVYPFLFSIQTNAAGGSAGYDVALCEEKLSSYENTDIPEECKANIIMFQMESFSDLRKTGLSGIADDVYSYYDELKENSISGRLAVNVYAGGTIDTEHCVLTGENGFTSISKDTPSFVRYLTEQGYYASGNHPNTGRFYNRKNTDSYFGFDDYYFSEEIYGALTEGLTPSSWCSDCILFPEVLAQYRQQSFEGKNVFSFNVTMQGHSPYDTADVQYAEESWNAEAYGGCSDYTYNVLNNYLGSVRDTLKNVKKFIMEAEGETEPIIVVLYGDHMPWLGDSGKVAEELKLNLSPATEEGFFNYYATDYFIFANSAAKELFGSTFTGKGPDISACYLMPLLFRTLGWKGDAYMAYITECMDMLPVKTSTGYYYEEGKIVPAIDASQATLEKASEMQNMEKYIRNKM